MLTADYKKHTVIFTYMSFICIISNYLVYLESKFGIYYSKMNALNGNKAIYTKF